MSSEQKSQQLESLLEIQEILVTQSTGRVKNNDIEVEFEKTLARNADFKQIWDKYMNTEDEGGFLGLVSNNMCKIIESDCDLYPETAERGILSLIAQNEMNYKNMYWSYIMSGRSKDFAWNIIKSNRFIETKNIQINIDKALTWLIHEEKELLVKNTSSMIQGFGGYIAGFIVIYLFSSI